MDERLEQELDEEFKQGLVAIRPYIERLTSHEDARLCRDWLTRLNQTRDRKEERNRLLARLVEQVKTGALLIPFRLPPDRAWLQEEHDYNLEYEENDRDLSIPTFHDEFVYQSFDESQFDNGSEQKAMIKKELTKRNSAPLLRTVEEAIEEENKNTEPFAENIYENYEDQVYSLQSTISCLQAQNEALTHEVQLYQKTSQRTQQNLQTVNEEVISLKARVNELQRINTSIEKSHNKALNEYKKSLAESLKLVSERLKEVSDQKLDLRNIITNLDSKLNIKYNEHDEAAEKKMKKEIEELKNQLTLERKQNQNKIRHLESVIEDKNEQLKKVGLRVKKQCSQMQQEVSHIKSEMDQVASEGQLHLKAKILSLKQQVSRLEKANKKLVTKYEQRLKGLEYKKDNSKTDSMKIEEMANLEKTVIELEERYRRIVSDIETRTANQRKLDIQRIQELEELLHHKN